METERKSERATYFGIWLITYANPDVTINDSLTRLLGGRIAVLEMTMSIVDNGKKTTPMAASTDNSQSDQASVTIKESCVLGDAEAADSYFEFLSRRALKRSMARAQQNQTESNFIGRCEYHPAILETFGPGGGSLKRRKITGNLLAPYIELANENTLDAEEGSSHSHHRPPPQHSSDEFLDAKIRVGDEFQAKVPKFVGKASRTQHGLRPTYEKVWDGPAFSTAVADGEPIEAILSKSKSTSSQYTFQLMERLHRAKYDVNNYRLELAAEQASSEHSSSIEFTDAQKRRFGKHVKSLVSGEMEFGSAAELVGCSVQKLLVHYYRWKGKHRDTPVYEQLSTKRKGELQSDEETKRTIPGSPRLRRFSHAGGRQPSPNKPASVSKQDRMKALRLVHKELFATAKRNQESPSEGKAFQMQEVQDAQSEGEPESDEVSRGSEHEEADSDNEQNGSPGAASAASSDNASLGDDDYEPVGEDSDDEEEQVVQEEEQVVQTNQIAFRSNVKKAQNGCWTEYTVTIPVTKNGLGISVRQTDDGKVAFCGYRQERTGPAQSAGVFLALGDIVRSVDGISLANVDYAEAIRILRHKPQKANGVKTLEMLSILDSSQCPRSSKPRIRKGYRTTPIPDSRIPGSVVYYAHVPVADHGLQIRLTAGKGKFAASFESYSRDNPQSKAGPAETSRVFLAKGDRVMEIDGVSCAGKTFEEVCAVAKQSASKNQITVLKMLSSSSSIVGPAHVAPASASTCADSHLVRESNESQNVLPPPPPPAHNVRDGSHQLDIRVTVGLHQHNMQSTAMEQQNNVVKIANIPLGSPAIDAIFRPFAPNLKQYFRNKCIFTSHQFLNSNADLLASGVSQELGMKYQEARDIVGYLRFYIYHSCANP